MNTITPASKMITLIKREFWEQRILFMLVPLCYVGMVFIFFIFLTIRGYALDSLPLNSFAVSIQFAEESAAEALERFAAAPLQIKENFWQQFYDQSSMVLFVSFWGIMIYYYLMTLYQQRKNRSILFWNSMPVSDTQTVLSKVFAGLLIAQGVFLISMLVMNLLVLITLSIYGSFFDVDVWNTFVAPAHIFSRFFWFLLFAFINFFWCLPVYAWLLLSSAWAKSAPLAWAGAPLLLVIIPELVMKEYSPVLLKLFEHLNPGWMFGPNPTGYVQGFIDRLQLVLTSELLISAILGIVLVVATIRINRSEDI
jgi:ABC-2 type transport system permease protein